MSVLAWLFGLGALAAVFPFLFHLIQRTPKGQVQFSSLMFLKPSPPRLTKRSRLENLLLLALRIAAISLIAFAFMRPFFKSDSKLNFSDLLSQKTAILLDTSASMRRGDLWKQALRRVEETIESAAENDEVAVYSFDSSLIQRKPFGPKYSGPNLLAHYELDQVQPGWSPSNLGLALVQLADEIDQKNDSSQNQNAPSIPSSFDGDSRLQLVVVTDLQLGSSTSALQNYQWPTNIKVAFEQVALKEQGNQSNASVQLLPTNESDPDSPRENVMVRNGTSSTIDRFDIAWTNPTQTLKGSSKPVSIYVPPGTSKILRVPRDSNSISSNSVILSGDGAAYDNQFFVVPPSQQKLTVSYLGNEERDDPEAMIYYLDRAMMDTALRSIEINQYSNSPGEQTFSLESGYAPDLIIVSRPVDENEQKAINSLLVSGSTLFVVLSSEDCLESTQQWTGVEAGSKFSDNEKDDYAMMQQVNFAHPVMEPFAGPRFNDFTQIRFWKHANAKLSDNIQVLASFDDGIPALWHQFVNSKSDVYVLGAGWQPSHSQLALSSKFLPLVNRILELAARTPQISESWLVGHPMELAEKFDQWKTDVGDPNSSTESESGKIDSENPLHESIKAPGIYTFSSSTDASQTELKVAVNVDPAESQIETMPLEQITAFDVQVGRHTDAAQELENQRVLLDTEMESRQKLWKWLIVAAIGFILVESWLAGRTDRANTVNEHHALEDAV